MNTLRAILLLLVLFGGAFYLFNNKESEEVVSGTVFEEEEIVEPELWLDTYTVSDGDTFATILEGWGIAYQTMLTILDTASTTYDFTRVRVGRDLRYKTTEGILNYLEYDMDTETMVVVEHGDGGYRAYEKDIEYEIERVVAKGSIETSLFEAALDVGVSEEAIIRVAEVFAWEIDFATEIQKGDTFAFVYEKRKRNGKDAPSGHIFAGKFITSGEVHYGYYFSAPDGEDGYYNEVGESLVRQFLKAPLSYSRITSGYTYARFHPTLGQGMPHRAIDYAAPFGTPIMSTADGTVTFAGWNGGYGNFVVVHHNDTYTTRYAHLSSYARGIRNGTKVVQSQVIGYVGSTGFSTGPHLHYEIMQNGNLVNPLTIDLPAGEPLKDEFKSNFEAVIAEFKPILDAEI